jgi:hypothetical protein
MPPSFLAAIFLASIALASVLPTSFLEAYSSQLKDDSSWTNGFTQNFNFASCSGARLVNMVNPGDPSAGQMAKTGSPHVVIMAAGGNNAGFYDIAMSCICQLDKDHDFGAYSLMTVAVRQLSNAARIISTI